MQIEELAAKWANAFEYHGSESPQRRISQQALISQPEILAVVKDTHHSILGAEEPLQPWLMDQIYYILEALGTSDGTGDGIRRSMATSVEQTPANTSTEGLLEWWASHPVYRSYCEAAARRLARQGNATIVDMYRAGMDTALEQTTNVLLSNLSTWCALISANEG